MIIETSTFWIMIGTWVAGIGTVGAVITSLYLASNSNKVKLKCNIGVYENTDSWESYLLINISNIGTRMTTIKFLHWEIDRGGEKRINFLNKYLIESLPLVILEGEEKSIQLDYNHWLTNISESTLDYDAKDLTLVISTIHDTFRIKIDKTLALKIMTERKRIANSSEN